MSSAGESPAFAEVEVGTRIPTQQVSVDERQLFLFSAASFNGHRIHYDQRWATEVEGYPDLLVHGPLQAALAAKVVTDWMGADGRLVQISSRNLRSVHPHEELSFVAQVTGKRTEGDRGFVELEVTAFCDGTPVMPGTATVSLPLRAAGAHRAGSGGA
jgi:hydroxyacyl-ACP dehydratase HTD2-like protein with hotdog domain